MFNRMRIVPDNNRQIIHSLSHARRSRRHPYPRSSPGPHRFVPALRGVRSRIFPEGAFRPDSETHHHSIQNPCTMTFTQIPQQYAPLGAEAVYAVENPAGGDLDIRIADERGLRSEPAFRRGGHGPLRRRPRPAPGAPLHPPRRQHGILRRHGTRRKGRGHGRSRRNASGRHGGDGSGEDLPAGTGSRGSPGAADDPAPPPDHPGRSLRRADPADRRRRRSGGDGPDGRFADGGELLRPDVGTAAVPHRHARLPGGGDALDRLRRDRNGGIHRRTRRAGGRAAGVAQQRGVGRTLRASRSCGG